MADDAGWIQVGAANLAKGEMRGIDVAGRQIALYHLEDGRWAATDNLCTHAYALLTEGFLDGAEIECPLHAGRFDILTGEALAAPAELALKVYEVRAVGGVVSVRID